MDTSLIKNKFISSSEASRISGYTPDYVARLCREGKVESMRVGRAWLVDRGSLITYQDAEEARRIEIAEALSAIRAKEYKISQDSIKAPSAVLPVEEAVATPVPAVSVPSFVPGTAPVSVPSPVTKSAPVKTPVPSPFWISGKNVVVGIALFLTVVGISAGYYAGSPIVTVENDKTHAQTRAAYMVSSATAATYNAFDSAAVFTYRTISSLFDRAGSTIASWFPTSYVALAPIEVRPPVLVATSTTVVIASATPSNVTNQITNDYHLTLNGISRESLDARIRDHIDNLNDQIDSGGGSGDGSVTSVDASGGTTGLAFTGGPVTSTGTLTLSGTLSATNGGTGQTSFAVGDILYADSATTLAKLPVGSAGQVLKVAGGIPSWSADLQGSGGAGAWATTSDSLAVYPSDISQVVLVGTSATTTTGNILEIAGNALFRNALISYGTVSAPNFTATTSAVNTFPTALFTNATTTSFGINSETFTDLTGTGLQNVGGALTLNATGDWTGTFDGQEGSYYLARANHTGTQLASTISDFSSTARGLFSSTATGLTYTSGTGVFSLTSGYSIPLTASTTEWNTFYTTPSARITAGTGLSWTGNTLNAQVQLSDLASYLALSAWYATTTDGLDEGTTNQYFTTARVQTYLDTLTKGYFFSTTSASYFLAQNQGAAFSTTSANYWETQQTARTADDLTNNSIEDLSDVAAMTENYGDLLFWNGTAWADIATSSLGIASAVWGNITGTLSNQTDLQNALDAKLSLASWYATTTDGLDEGTTNQYFTNARARTAISETITGIDYTSGTGVFSLTSGFSIPLSASTTEWAQAYASTTALSNSYIRNLFSNSATGLTYNSTTGATSLTAGYTIPLTASTTDWQTAFSWGNHATAGYALASNLFAYPFVGNATTTNIAFNGGLSASTLSVGSLSGVLYGNNGAVSATATSTASLGLGLSGSLTTIGSGNSLSIATSSLYAGTNGQVLARVNGAWVGVATTTAGTGLTYDGTSFNLNTSGDWTGTFDGQEGSYYLARANHTGTQLASTISDFNTAVASYINASSTIAKPAGGTLGNIISWNGSAWVSVATSTLGLQAAGSYESPLTFSYPLTRSGNTVSLAFGTSTSNTWGGTQTFTNPITVTSTTGTSTLPNITGSFISGFGLAECSDAGDKLVYNNGVFSCGADAGAGGGITAIGAQYSSFQNGSSQTLATSSDTNIALTITSAGNVHTFTPSWVGTLASDRGGTGISSVTANQLLIGNAGGTGWTQVATSSLGLPTFATLAGYFSLSDWYATTTDGLDEGTTNQYFTNARVLSYLNTLSKGYFFSTTSADYWETQQTARTADDLTNNSIEDLSDVAAMTENYGDLLFWNGTAWADIATSSLGLTVDTNGDWTGTFDGQEGSYYLARANHTGTQLASTISDFSSTARGLFSSTATGLTYTSGTGVFSLTSGYSIPLTASTTEWNTFYTTPSSRISVANNLSWTGNTLGVASGYTIPLTASTTDWQTAFSWGNHATAGYALASNLFAYPFVGNATTTNIAFNGGLSASTLSVGSLTGLLYANNGAVSAVSTSTWTFASSTLLANNNTFSGNNTFSNTITGSVSGNAGTATALQNARTINGVSFNGTANITITAASSTLLTDNNTFSGSNAYGTPSSITLTNATGLPIVGGTTGTLTVARGGTGTTTAPAGQVLYGGGAGVYQSVATTSATIGAGLSYSGTFGALLGGASGTLSLNATGDWTGTFDGLEGSAYLANSFSTTSAQYFVHSSTTIPKTYAANTFTNSNVFNGGLTIGSLNGPLQANNGVVSATTSVGATYGGTGQTSYVIGDILYADSTGSLAKLPIGTAGQVLKVTGGLPQWGVDLTTGGGGGAGAWSTTTDSLAIYPTDTSNVVIIGNSATTTTTSIFEVSGRSYFSNNLSIATTSTANRLTVDGTTLLGGLLTLYSGFNIGGETFTDLTGTGLQNVGGALTLNATGDWTGTFDGLEGSAYLANSFSTTSAQYFVHSSTTIPKTYAANTFTGTQTFNTAEISDLFVAALYDSNDDFGNEGEILMATLTGPDWVATSTLGLPTFSDVASSLINYLSLASWYATTTDGLDEGTTNQYFTDARARTAISETITGIDYTSGTGVFSLTSGYTIPLTASTTNWNAFYDAPSSRITAGNNIDWTGNTLDVITTGDWTGTFDGQEGSYYLARANHTGTQLASTISDFDAAVNSYLNASTTIPKTYTTNTFSNTNTFNGTTNFGGSVDLGSQNGPLQANNGVVSATTSIGVLYGGTGLTSAPAYGNILVGNSSGGYTLTATSSLGLITAAVQNIGPAGQTADGPTVTFATSSTAFNGLTPALTITGSGDTLTYTSSLSGTLDNAGLTNSTVSYGGVTLALGGTDATPAFNLVDATGLPISTGVAGLGTGVATALGVNVGTAGSFVVNGGALGTPSSGTLTNATGLPIVGGTTGTLTVARGGTGWAAVQSGAVLYGNGTGALATTTAGTNGYVLALAGGVPTWVATSSINNGVSSLQQSFGSAQTGAITLATSSAATSNGVTVGQNITNSGGTFTFTPTVTVSNIPNAALQNSTISGIALGGNLADLTAGNSSLTFSGSYNGSTARTVSLNTANANSWTALQSFANASSTLFSNTGTAYFGGTATTTIASTGAITTPATLTVSSGGANITGNSTITGTLGSLTGLTSSGTITFSSLTGGLLYANGSGVLSSVATSSWTFASSTLLANNNTWTGLNTFGNLIATNATTTSFGINSETFTDLTGTGLQNVGGALTLNATGDWTGTFDGQEGSYYLARANHTGTQLASTISDFSTAARALFSASFPLAYNSGTGAFTYGGLSTSTAAVVGNIPYFSGANTFANVATSSLAVVGPFNITGTLGSLVGGSNSTVTYTGLATTTTLSSSQVLVSNGGAGVYGVSTSTTSLGLGLSGSLTTIGSGNSLSIATSSLYAGTNGQVLARVNGAWVGVATTTAGTGLTYDGTSFNLNTSGDWTGTFDGLEGSAYLANSFSTTSAQYFVHSSTTIPKTYTTNTFSALQTFNAGVTSNALTLGTLNGPLQANAGVVSATSSIGVLYGGTGLTSAPAYGNILVGNSSGGYTLTATSSLGLITAAVQNIGPAGQTADGPTVTLATSTSAFNGLTAALTVVGSGDTLTLTPSLSGTLNNAGLTNSTISGIALGGNLADLTAGNSSLTFSGSYNGSTARTVSLNTANANSWTALQSFANASSTLFSNTGTAYFGGTATTTIASTGAITTPATLTVSSGGANITGNSTITGTLGSLTGLTSSGTITFSSLTGGLLYANGSGVLSSVATSSWTFASSTLLANNNTFSGNNTFSNTITGSISGNAGTATALQTARNINGVSFNGTADITITAASSTLLANNNTWTGLNTFGNLLATNATTTSFGINSETFTDLTGTGLQNVGGALTLNATGDWSGTFDGLEGSAYLANSFSTTSAQYFVHSSTTIPKTYTTNTFSALQTFNAGVTSNALTLGTLNGPLQANAGVVSATSSIGVLYGGTGLTSAPAYGNILVGNSSGGYTLTATSSLGLAPSFTTTYPIQYSSNILSLAFGTTTNNVWSGTNNFTSTLSNGSSSPYAKFTIHANNGENYTNNTLFAIGSSTASATTTLFNVSNAGVATLNNGANTVSISPGSGIIFSASGGGLTTGNGQAITNGTVRLDSTRVQIADAAIFAWATVITGANNTSLSRLASGVVGVGNGTAGNISGTFVGERLGLGTTTPYAQLAIVATSTNGVGAPTTLFAIASTTAGTATSSLFTIGNTGTITTTLGDGLVKSTGGVLSLATGGTDYANFSYPFPSNATTTALSFNGGLTTSALTLGSLNGPLHANGGVVSATSSIGVLYGGTGLTSAPAYGQVLVGQADGSYVLTATSSLGFTGGTNYLTNSGAFTYLSTGRNFGVGTSSPYARLSIHGSATEPYTPYLFAIGSSTSSFATTTLFSIAANGVATFGDSNGTGNASVQFGGDSNAWSVGYETGSKSFIIASSTDLSSNVALAITKSGNIGIGSTTPSARLSVQGNALISGNTATAGLTATGTVAFSGLTNGLLYANGSGVLSSVATSSWTFASSTLLANNNTFSGNNTFSNTITGSISGNAGTATALQTARNINGVSFNGTADITITAASSTLLANNNTFSGTNSFTGNLTLASATSTNLFSTRLTANTAAFGQTGSTTISSTGALSAPSLTLGSLNGPLQANNGVVSATTSVGVLYGGTGLTSAPAYGNILVGNSSGGYTLTATSSLGLATFGYPFTYASTYGATAAATTSPLWAQGGLYASSTVAFGTAGNSLYFDSTNGRLGLGSTTPTKKLVVQFDSNANSGTAVADGLLIHDTNVGSTWDMVNANASIDFGSSDLSGVGQGGRARIGTVAETLFGVSHRLGFFTAPTTAGTYVERMSILANGNVGIGTSTPSEPLSVNRTDTGLIISAARADVEKFSVYASTISTILTAANGNQLRLGVAAAGGVGSNALIIDTNNNIGIGDTTPASLLTVGNGDLFQVNSSGAIAAATGITSSGTITFSGLTGGLLYANGSGVLSSVSTSTWSFASSTLLANNNTFSGANSFTGPNSFTGNLTLASATSTNLFSTRLTANTAAFGQTGSTTVSSTGALSTPSLTLGSLSGVFYGVSGVTNAVATSSITVSPTAGGLSYSGTLGAFVGGTGGTLSVATSSLYTGTTGQVPYFSGTNTLIGTSSLFIATNANVGIGSTSPYAKFSITNTGTAPSFIVEDSTSPDTTPFIIDASGNVGIGSSTPRGILTVSAAGAPNFLDIEMTGGGYGLKIERSASNRPNIQSYILSSGATDNLILNEDGGFVGIGTSSPTTQLSLDGQTSAIITLAGGRTGNSGNFGSIDFTNTDTVRYTGARIDSNNDGQADDGTLRFYTNSDGSTSAEGNLGLRMLINSDGNIGIGGETSPASLLTVGNGDLFQVNSSGAIAAATGITSSGTITFSGLTGGLLYANGSGVLSSVSTSTWSFASSTLLANNNTFSGANIFSSTLTANGTFAANGAVTIGDNGDNVTINSNVWDISAAGVVTGLTGLTSTGNISLANATSTNLFSTRLTANTAAFGQTGSTTVSSTGALSTPSLTLGSLSGVFYGVSGVTNAVATSSITVSPTAGGLSYSGTLGAFVGGTGGTLSVATSSLYTGTTGQVPYFSGTNTLIGTSSLFIATNGMVGVGTTTTGNRNLTVSAGASTQGLGVFSLGAVAASESYASALFKSGVSNGAADVLIVDADTASTRGALQIQGNGGATEVAFFAASGNVGIGTTSPATKIDVYSTSAADLLRLLRVGGSGGLSFNGDNGLGVITGTPIATAGSYGLGFEVTAAGVISEAMRISSAGQLLVGTTSSPTTRTTIASGADANLALVANANGKYWGFDTINSDGRLRVANGVSGEVLTITEGGKVGIGSTSPRADLSILSSGTEVVRISGLTSGRGIFADNGLTSGIFSFTRQDTVATADLSIAAFGGIGLTGGSTTYNNAVSSGYDMYITSTGNVGIGTTSPLGRLHVTTGNSGAGAVSTNADELVIEGTSASGMTILSANNNLGYINFGDPDDTDVGGISYSHISNSLNFAANNLGITANFDGTSFYNFSTTDPEFRLSDNTINAKLKVEDASGLAFVGSTSNHPFQIRSNNIGALTIDTAQNVGIGSTSPYAKLSVTNTGSGPSFVIEDSASPDTTPLLVDASGNMALGTTTPSKKLVVAAGNAADVSNGLLVERGTGGYNGVQYGLKSDSGGQYRAAISIFGATGTEVESISFPTGGATVGYVGIGTTTPTEKLSVLSSDNTSGTNIFAVRALNLTQGVGIGYNTIRSLGTNANVDLNLATQGTGDLIFATGGSTDLTIDGSTGDVGIGTTTPDTLLHLAGNSGAGTGNTNYLRLSELDTTILAGQSLGIDFYSLDASAPNISSGYIRSVAVNAGSQFALAFGSANGADAVEGLRLDFDGQVGIGTTTPAAKLDVYAASGAGLYVEAGAGGADVAQFSRRNGAIADLTISTASGDPSVILGANGTDAFIMGYDASATSFAIATGNALGANNRFVIDSAGKVGVGTSTPWGQLSASSTSAFPTFAVKQLGAGAAAIFEGGEVGIATTSPMSLLSTSQTTSGYAATLSSTLASGWVGIQLLSGDLSEVKTVFQSLELSGAGLIGTESNHPFLFRTNNTEQMRITAGGNVGIGTTTPAQTLSVQGNQYTSGTAFFGGAVTATSTVTLSNYTNGLLYANGSGVLSAVSTSTWSFPSASSTLLADNNTWSGTNTFSNTLTTNGTLDANGILTLGDNGDNITIDSSVWDISAAGAATGFTGITTSGTLSGAVGTFSGTLTANGTFAANGAVTIGDNGDNVTINSNVWDISAAGVVTGLTGLTSTGNISLANATSTNLFSTRLTANTVSFGQTASTTIASTGALSTPALTVSGNTTLASATSTNLFSTRLTANTVSFGQTASTTIASTGAITTTGITSSGTITFSGLTNGLLYANGSGVLSSVATSSWSFASSTLLANNNTFSGANIFSSTLTANGTFAANGVVTIGDNGDNVTINSNVWDISSAGVASGFTGITSTGNISLANATSTNLFASSMLSANQLRIGGTATTTIATNGDISIGGGTGKITVGTIDPVYTVNGVAYATYGTGMIGIKEEAVGTAYITTQTVASNGTKGYVAVLDFDAQEAGSDLWLFAQTTHLRKHIGDLVVLLTAEHGTKVWYEIDEEERKVYLLSNEPTRVSYRLTAPRFDAAQWSNYNHDGVLGFLPPTNDELDYFDEEDIEFSFDPSSLLSGTTTLASLIEEASGSVEDAPWAGALFTVSDGLKDAMDVLSDKVTHAFEGVQYFADGIFARIFAGEIYADKFCVTDENGETCLTRSQLDALIAGAAAAQNTGNNEDPQGGGEEPPSEEPPAEEPPADEPPVEEPPAEETPSDEPPAEEPPAEESAPEEPPADEPAAEEPPADEPSGEDSLAAGD